MNVLRRATAPTDLEVRGDGRTVVGIACPYDSPALISGPGGSYHEVFRRGSFARTISERGPSKVKFYAEHASRSLPLGRAELLREDAAGLYCELRVSQTAAGDEALALIRDNALDALSVGFSPVRESRNESSGLVERTEVRLHEISAVSWPAYDGARILAVRHDLTLRGETPLLTRARRAQRLAELLVLETS
jgi:uncharacterized protein